MSSVQCPVSSVHHFSNDNGGPIVLHCPLQNTSGQSLCCTASLHHCTNVPFHHYTAPLHCTTALHRYITALHHCTTALHRPQQQHQCIPTGCIVSPRPSAIFAWSSRYNCSIFPKTHRSKITRLLLLIKIEIAQPYRRQESNSFFFFSSWPGVAFSLNVGARDLWRKSDRISWTGGLRPT